MTPEKMEYDWWYRDDGKAVFDMDHPSVSAGHEGGSRVRFGPFDVDWSAHTSGSGWLYYSNFPGARAGPEDPYMCVTGLHSLEGVDAADAKWIYGASPAP